MTLKIIICLCFLSLTGIFAKEDRIVGGRVAGANEFPYLATIRRDFHNELICAATIISKWNVLTTAHCIVPYENQLSTIKIATGSVNSAQIYGTYRIESVHYHPQFDRITQFFNNICLIKLRHPIIFSEFQNAIPLPSGPPESGNLALVAGFGVYDDQHGPLLSLRLRKAVVYTLTAQECQDVLPYQILETHFCTYHNFAVGVCPGDAGGPVVVNGELYGIISYSSHECGNNAIDVHTSVHHNLHFILQLIQH